MNPNFEKPFTFDRAVRLFIGIAIFVLFFFLIQRLGAVLLPFLGAWMFAYMIYPLVKFYQYKLRVKYRVIAVVLALVSIFSIITMAVWLLTPLISHEYEVMRVMVNDFINDSANGYFMFIPAEWVDAIRNLLLVIDLESFFNAENLANIAQQAYPKLLGIITSSFRVLISLFIFFIVMLYIFFILLDYEMLEKEWVKFVPVKYRQFAAGLADDLRMGMNKYFRNQALIAFTVGILFAIGLSIVNFPLGITLGLFLGVLNLVPYLQLVGLIPLTLLAAIKAIAVNENFFLIFLPAIAVLAIVQVIQDAFLVPKIMGRTTGLKPAVILLSLSIWGSLLGIVGMIIALPTTTLLISYYRRFVLWEVKKAEAEIPPPEEAKEPDPPEEEEEVKE